MLIRREGMGDPFFDDNAAIRQRRNLVRIVGHQPDFAETKQSQDLGGGKIDPLIGVETQLLVGVDGIEAPVLELVGPELVAQTNTAALLRKVQQDTGAGGGDFLDRALKLVSAITPKGA